MDNSQNNLIQYQQCALAMVNITYREDATESGDSNPTLSEAGVYCTACKPGYKRYKPSSYIPYMV